MAAKKGNKTAEKWTEKTVLDFLKKIESHAADDTCLYLGNALVRVGLYKEIWSYWKDKFSENDHVFQPIKKIEQIFEDKLFSGALSGDHVPSVAIFGLKNNHGWKDKTEVETTERRIYEHFTDEELEAEKKRLERIANIKAD